MVTFCWSIAGVIHHSFLPNGMSITADVYCEEVHTMMEKFEHLQPVLVNRSSPLVLHDNVRSHTAQQKVSKLQELGLEALRHPPYLLTRRAGKTFNTREAVQNGFEEFVACRPADFFKVINKQLSALAKMHRLHGSIDPVSKKWTKESLTLTPKGPLQLSVCAVK